METFYIDDIAEVLDKSLKVRYIGSVENAVEWICDFPLDPHMVYIRETNDFVSVDQFMKKWDELEYD